MKARRSLFLLFVLSLLLLLAACSGKNSSTDSTEGNNNNEGTETEQGTEQSSEGGQLVFVTASDAPTLDPHGVNDTASNNVTTQILTV